MRRPPGNRGLPGLTLVERRDAVDNDLSLHRIRVLRRVVIMIGEIKQIVCAVVHSHAFSETNAKGRVARDPGPHVTNR